MAEEKAPKKNHGFIIYRGDYNDDAQWERFMAYLKYSTRCGLEEEDKPELYDRMDWKVMSSPDMQDEDPEEIYERFIKWLESGEEEIDSNNYRYRACVLVNKACLDCLDNFMEGKSLETDDDLELFDHMGFTFAILISVHKEEGWTLVGTSYLMPRAGDIMMLDYDCGGWNALVVPDCGVAVNF